MNPYLAATVAMCTIVVLSLAATAYLAAMFNRRAKTDLAARLDPLAEAIGGETDLDGARVTGRYGGRLVFGRVASAPGGFGRLFHVEVVDAAGGDPWEWSSLPAKEAPAPTRAFDGGPDLERLLGVDWAALAEVVPEPNRQRFGFLYDPAAGMVRLSRAMRTRLDIPDPAAFLRQLDELIRLGEANRRAQQPPEPGAVAESVPGASDAGGT